MLSSQTFFVYSIQATELRAKLKRKHVYMPENCELVQMGTTSALDYAGVTEADFISNIHTLKKSKKASDSPNFVPTSTPRRDGPSGMTLRRRRKAKHKKLNDFVTTFDTDCEDFV